MSTNINILCYARHRDITPKNDFDIIKCLSVDKTAMHKSFVSLLEILWLNDKNTINISTVVQGSIQAGTIPCVPNTDTKIPAAWCQ